MAVLSDRLTDGAKLGRGAQIVFYARGLRDSVDGDAILTQARTPVSVDPTDGSFTTPNLEPGPYWCGIKWAAAQSFENFQIVIGDSDTRLWPLLEEALPYTPAQESLFKQYRDEVAEFVTTAEGLSTAQDEAVAELVAPGTATKAVLDGTYAPADIATSVSESERTARFARRGQPNMPAHQTIYRDKADTAAGIIPPWDTGLAVTAIDTGDASAMPLRIVGGYLTAPVTYAGASAGYAHGDAGAPITLIGARWKFDKTSRTTNGASICLALLDAPTKFTAPMPNIGVHMTVSAFAWTVDYKASSGAITNIASGAFESGLAQDNLTEHEVQVFRSGSTVRLLLPDGTITAAITHANIGAWSGRYFFYECFAGNGSTDARIGIANVWVGTGGQIMPTQQAVTRKILESYASWEPVIKGLYSTARAVGVASMPLYITTNRTVGAVAYFLGTPDATGSMTVELRSDNVLIPGTSVTIAAGAVQGVASGPFTLVTGKKITIHINAAGGTPGIGIDAQMIRP